MNSTAPIPPEVLRTFTLQSEVGNGETTACLMSARSLLDGRGLTDEHPSRVIRALGIKLNDGPWWDGDVERTAVLLPIALDERLCASKCDARMCCRKAVSSCSTVASEIGPGGGPPLLFTRV